MLGMVSAVNVLYLHVSMSVLGRLAQYRSARCLTLLANIDMTADKPAETLESDSHLPPGHNPVQATDSPTNK